MSSGSGTGTPTTPSELAEIEDIRYAINIENPNHLGDLEIQSAIGRSTSYFTALESQYSAPSELFPSARKAYAIYLAYKTYADRVVQLQPGQYVEGKWTPLADEILRDTSAKLDGFRKVYEDLKALITWYPRIPFGTFQSHKAPPPRFRIGQYDYGYPENIVGDGTWI